MPRNRKTRRETLQPNMIYSKEDALEILNIPEQEFDKLKIRESEIRSTGEIVYDSEDLWPHVYSVEYQQSAKK